MKRKLTWWGAVGLAGMICFAALGQGSKADYDRALSLAQRTEGTVFRSKVKPVWLPGGTRFWYRVETGPGREEYVWVDAVTGERRLAFDAARLAKALSTALGKEVAADSLGLSTLEFVEDGAAMVFTAGGRGWRYRLADGDLSSVARAEAEMRSKSTSKLTRGSTRTGAETEIVFVNQTKADAELYWLDASAERRGYGRLRPGQERRHHTYEGHVWLLTDTQGTVLGVFEAGFEPGRAVVRADAGAAPKSEPDKVVAPSIPGISPDGKWVASIENHNVVMKPSAGGDKVRLSEDGTSEDPYETPVSWSPDSRRVVVIQRRQAQKHPVHIVQSSPTGQLQPKLITHDYLKPGDQIAHPRPRLFDVASGKRIEISEALFENPWELSELQWQPDSAAFSFLYNQRGHRVLRMISVDAGTGATRTVVEEVSKTFVDYAHKFHLTRLDRTGEILWMSERSGWNHLWLVDVGLGRIKNPVTHGDWVVRKVEHVDSEKRQVWFMAGGIRPGQDPYQLQLGRVNFDGTGLVVLTEGDGSHTVEFSPDRRWFLDTWSRPDAPPVIELRRAEDGKQVCVLERADWSRLLESGWTVPERIEGVARDGKTPIYGILVKPSNFDSGRKYPVVEEVYAGPQGAFVPKQFGRLVRHHAMAELGFVVVQIDGMGTSYRSKAFHDVSAGNLADAGFEDRKGWIRAAARTRPWMDLSRVGIYGGSAGGQNAMRALLDHGDFYSVAVADCGCHDNRMDKIWWNELWLGWPVGEAYVKSSNVEDAAKLTGHLMLVVGELDSNVDPASTMQVVNALQKADKDYELVVVTGADHGAAETPYGSRRRMDFLVRHLHGREPRWVR